MENSENKISAFCIAGTSSGDGKTTVTLALLRALYRRGLAPQPFKCGPDYIDPSFHNIASKKRSRNLDCWMMGKQEVKTSFASAVQNAGSALVEGVMGLFDGANPVSLTGSTAETAALLEIPVILVVNCRGMAGSIAAIVKGYSEYCHDIKVIGVIANQTGSDAHAEILREALKASGMPPLLGCLPRNEKWKLPERHLGLLPFTENSKSEAWFDELADAAEKYIDIDQIMEITKITRPSVPVRKCPVISGRLAIADDEAFHFYYEDNLDILIANGIELVKFSPLHDTALPAEIGGIYIGGGFPEVFAERLEKNSDMRQAVKEFASGGGIVYAECGGYMYLSSSIRDNGRECEMCDLIPAKIRMGEKLRSLGYREVRSLSDTFLGPSGTLIRGHEFHWSAEEFDNKPQALWLASDANKKAPAYECGYHNGNICASYIHLHWASCPEAAANFAEAIIKQYPIGRK